ncbi:MAG TPA: OsmC family protein [Candidatus Kapabacteria bacterium]|nr:OsmC family protein [Candidatus Kapabacteria bacterium]
MTTITAHLDEGTRVALSNGRHTWYGDEPLEDAGTDTGPTPYELLLGSLAACTTLTLRFYARRKGIDLKWVRTRYEFDRIHSHDCQQCDEDVDAMIERVRSSITIGGTFDDAERSRLEYIVGRCPVHKTLANGMKIFDTVEFANDAE